MPGFNGSGTFELRHDWTADASANIAIRADRMDAQFDDIAAGLSNCITKDGQTTITADIPLGGNSLTGIATAEFADGSAATPSLTFTNDLDCGFYRIGANRIGFSVNGTKVAEWATTGGSYDVTPLMYGAAGDGTTDDRAALDNALDSGLMVDGLGKTYAINGNLAPSSFCRLKNAVLKQTGDSASVRTLLVSGINDVYLENVRVEKNAAEATQDHDEIAGIWVASGARVRLIDCEVTLGTNTGIVVNACTDVLLRGCYVHDMAFDVPSAAGTDEFVQGIWINACDHVQIVDCKVEDLTGQVNSVASDAHTRAIVVSGSDHVLVNGCHVRNVNQGIDLTGSSPNRGFAIVGNYCHDVGDLGIKTSNTTSHGVISGNTVHTSGLYGILISGNAVEDVNVVGNTVIDAATAGIYVGTDTSNGFPRGIKIANNVVEDTNNGSTTDYGYQFSLTANGAWMAVEMANNTAQNVGAFSDGYPEPETRLSVAAFPSANNTWDTVDFGTEVLDNLFAFDAGTSTANVVVPAAGRYEVSVVATWATNATGFRGLRVRDGSTVQTYAGLETLLPVASGDGASVQTISGSVQLAKGATLTVQTFQDSGAALNVAVFLGVRKVG